MPPNALPPPHNMEQRLTELEIKLSFQDDALEQLNAVIVRQQQELDQLRRAVHSLQLQWQQSSASSALLRDVAAERPPHY